MAIYRQLHTTFWKDKRVGEWSKDQKLFFLYLLSNDYTTQCGVYEFNIRYAKFELDMTAEEIKENIDFLVSEGRIVFNEKSEELMIVNWLKYNNARSPKVAAVIDKELKEIKTLEFEIEVIKKCQEYKYPIQTLKPKENTLSIGYGYGIDTITQPTPASTTSSSPTPATTEEGKKAAAPANPFQLYQEVFGVLNGLAADDLRQWVEDIGEELVCEAIKRSALDQKSYGYAKGIMQSWVKKNIKTMADVKADDVRHKNQSNFNKKPLREEKLPDWAVNEQAEEQLSPERQAELDAKLAAYLNKTKQ